MEEYDENKNPDFKSKKEKDGEKPVFHIFDREISDDDFVDAIEEIINDMKKKNDENKREQ